MKKLLAIAAVVAGSICGSAAWAEIHTLDLTKSTTPLSFNAENGAWTETFNDDELTIESQCFIFYHSSMSDYDTWWGFTASNSADNARQTNTLLYQYSNMAKGGIVLNEDGTVATTSFGAPQVSADVPYLVGYYSKYMSRRPVDMMMADGKAYNAVGVYVNLNSYPYYCVEEGDAYCRAFTDNDRLTLTIHGVAPDQTETSIDVTLASYNNGDLTINRGWKYVDLTSLGTVNEIYFTMSSTDVGDWGENTPLYFCLDKLMVEDLDPGAIQEVAPQKSSISYDQASTMVTVADAEFTTVSDVAGRVVFTSFAPQFSIEGLPHGVYVIKAGDACVKVVR